MTRAKNAERLARKHGVALVSVGDTILDLSQRHGVDRETMKIARRLAKKYQQEITKPASDAEMKDSLRGLFKRSPVRANGVQPRDEFLCGAQHTVMMLGICLRDYVDATAYEHKDHVCWQCPQGRQNRLGYAAGAAALAGPVGG